jgi:hypothetical protein
MANILVALAKRKYVESVSYQPQEISTAALRRKWSVATASADGRSFS